MVKNTVQAQAWLEKCYPDSAPSKTTLKRWFADFKRGRTDIDDAERPGWPNGAVITENIEKPLNIIMGNGKMKLQEIADTWKLSKSSVCTIIHKHLGMKKMLHQRKDYSKKCLEMFTRNKKGVFASIHPNGLNIDSQLHTRIKTAVC
nr:uncharacterized protein LOC121128383 [Lepeophtheirus salmonis]